MGHCLLSGAGVVPQVLREVQMGEMDAPEGVGRGRMGGGMGIGSLHFRGWLMVMIHQLRWLRWLRWLRGEIRAFHVRRALNINRIIADAVQDQQMSQLM